MSSLSFPEGKKISTYNCFLPGREPTMGQGQVISAWSCGVSHELVLEGEQEFLVHQSRCGGTEWGTPSCQRFRVARCPAQPSRASSVPLLVDSQGQFHNPASPAVTDTKGSGNLDTRVPNRYHQSFIAREYINYKQICPLVS